ncbi:AraC family transcriptional regulator [Streptomyces sp. NP160]|uniref:AraC family transcriptional regulator n=1 Tax=Streptomyces sp. NP160 TaxID=2586637 RepID=UPI001117E5A1|nr:AraC family transcriptional regulator [Streptomyces sp. NP160]TNM59557.1 AraC family transcriptional regulator [Streptomyces sp. NP160]
MIDVLNRLVEQVEERLADGSGELDVARLARSLGTTEHHLRRMFSSLAGMPLSEYVRRRRLTVAAADVLATDDDLLTIAVRHGYGSAEAFGRAFAAVHGTPPGQVRRDGGPVVSQPRLSFHLTVRGSTPMDVRIVDHPAFRLVGHAARVPLLHSGTNPHIAAHVAAIAPEEHARLTALSEVEPRGLLSVSDDLDPDRTEGSELTFLHGVATRATTPVPADLDAIEVAAGAWAVFRSSGPHPAALQQLWADTATEWFPSNSWRLRPGPEVLSVLEHDDGWTTAACELWLPVERA